MIGALADNPLVARRLRIARDFQSLMIVAVMATIAYGVVAIALISGAGRLNVAGVTAHWAAIAMNVLAFMLVAPVQMANLIATEREKKTLDLLRLTGISGDEIARGAVLCSYGPAVLVFIITLPLVIAGAFSTSVLGAAVAYLALFQCSLLGCAVAGVAAFNVNKAQRATGVALIATSILSVGGGLFAFRAFASAAVFAPWAAMTATVDAKATTGYVISFLGLFEVNASIAQPFIVLPLVVIILKGLGGLLARDQTACFGRNESVAVAALVALWFGVTFEPISVERIMPVAELYGPSVAMRLGVVMALLIVAGHDSAVGRDDVIRGFARRAAASRPYERVSYGRFPLIAAVVLLLLLGPIAPRVAVPRGVISAGLAAWGGVVLAAAVFQTTLVKVRTAPSLLGGAVLFVLWIILPGGFGTMGSVFEMPSELRPFLTILTGPGHAMTAAMLADPTGKKPVFGFDPLNMAILAGVVDLFLAAGALFVVHSFVDKLEDRAAELVALPADAFAPAGSTERRCEKGHVYASTWAACPHCPAPPPVDRKAAGA